MMNRMNVLRIVALLILICLMISPVALAYEELAKGSKGDAVVELQERLNELGYSVGTADGDFGNKTYNAIVSYQTDRGLDATGIATVELQELMDKELIYLNSLNRIGYTGTDSRNVVSKYQEDNGLEATGFLNEATIQRIDSEIEETEREEAAIADLVIVDAADAGNVGSYGYASITTRQVVIPCEWTHLGQFSEGLAYAGTDKQYGYIDIEGNVVIPTMYEDAANFSEGLAAVKLNGKWGYIDYNGDVAIDFMYEDAANFSEGLAAVKVEELWGYINQDGELIITNQWDLAKDFAAGSAVVADISNQYRYGLINTNGEHLLEVKYKSIDELSNGLRRIEQFGDKSGFVDAAGNIVIPIEWDYAYDFSPNGLAPVKKAGEWGYIDKTGDLVIPCIYEQAIPFSDGLAAVMKDKWHFYYIDSSGTTIVDTEEDWGKAGSFINGYAYISDSVEHEYTDADGVKHKYFAYYAWFINKKGEKCIETHPDAIPDPVFGGRYFGDNGVCAVVLPDAEIVQVGGTKYARVSYVNTEGQIVIKDAGWNVLQNRAANQDNQSLNDLAVRAVVELKANLKNPPSLQLHSITAYQDAENLNSFYFVVDYSAMNSFGGYVRNNAYISANASSSASLMDDGGVFHFKSFTNNYTRLGSININEVIAKMN